MKVVQAFSERVSNLDAMVYLHVARKCLTDHFVFSQWTGNIKDGLVPFKTTKFVHFESLPRLLPST
jgi:hypothetical protein